jgi:glycosyltransferase involved in cell wall biosynthesis
MLKNNNYFVSIIIPCRNEERFIGKCLDSIIAQDYSKDKLEILVVDGMSNDKTREIIKEYSKQHQYINLLDNQGKIVPTALNIGIQKAQGTIIVRMPIIFTKKSI